MENKIQDSVFGELIWEEEYKDWIGNVELQPNLIVSVNISGEREKIVSNIAEFYEIFKNLRQNEAAARNFAAEKLLKLYNESWREDDEEVVTQQEFCQRIRPERIVIHNDNKRLEIYYQDDDLFWGHSIIVSINEEGNFREANIAG